MMFAALLVAAALPFASAIDIPVNVGASGLTYTPPFVTANEGDTVTFTFHPKNHTVTQSSFASPCVALPNGFDSDFKPVAADTGILPTWKVTVSNASIPLWFYCKQPLPAPHCSQGMVFAINPPAEGTDHSFSNFKNLAMGKEITTSTTATGTDYVTVSAQPWQTATATVSNGTETWVTTYTSYLGSASPSVAAQPMDHVIIVGVDGNLAYGPANISASIGDTVTFQFHPKNHTVTQSSFSAPCQPIGDTVAGKEGFKSGFVPVDPSVTDFQNFTITVNDTAPIWGYCGQLAPKPHCGAGMVFAINAVETGPNNFDAFQKLAIHINGTATTGGGASSSGSATSSGAGATKTNSAIGVNGNGKDVVVVLGLILGFACFL